YYTLDSTNLTTAAYVSPVCSFYYVRWLCTSIYNPCYPSSTSSSNSSSTADPVAEYLRSVNASVGRECCLSGCTKVAAYCKTDSGIVMPNCSEDNPWTDAPWPTGVYEDEVDLVDNSTYSFNLSCNLLSGIVVNSLCSIVLI